MDEQLKAFIEFLFTLNAEDHAKAFRTLKDSARERLEEEVRQLTIKSEVSAVQSKGIREFIDKELK